MNEGDKNGPNELAALRQQVEELKDKALRFDLDQTGIEQREREAAELVELRAKVEALNKQNTGLYDEALRNLRAYQEADTKVEELTRERDEAEHEQGRLLTRAERAEARLAEAQRDAERANVEFCRAIDFAINQNSEADLFLKAWREGDTDEWPEFDAAREPRNG